jgi:hypothetical protein
VCSETCAVVLRDVSMCSIHAATAAVLLDVLLQAAVSVLAVLMGGGVHIC